MIKNTKPSLLIVADTYYPKVDGTLIFMEEFLKRSKESFNTSLLVPDLGVHKGEQVTYLTPSKLLFVSGYPSLKFTWRNVHRLKRTIKSAGIVFIQGPALISYLSIYYAHKYHKRTIFYTHTIAWELFEKFFPPLLNKLFLHILKRISISLYNLCDEILVPYHDLKTHLHKEGVTAKMTVARLGVDIDRFSPSKDKRKSKQKVHLNPHKIVIGYVGRISKEKNIKVLREAFKKLPAQGQLHLLMVGDGPEDQIKEFKAMSNCTVTGFVHNVEDYLQAVDIFVMPSLTETTSLATLEAMSCGLPVIATQVGFIKHYLTKGENGLFFPRNSPSMLAAKIEKLRHEKQFAQKLGESARKTVAYSFSWDRSINKIKRILLEER